MQLGIWGCCEPPFTQQADFPLLWEDPHHPHQSNITNPCPSKVSLTHQCPPPHQIFSPHDNIKVLVPLLLPRNGTLKSKKVIKTFSVWGTYFYENCQFMTMKACCWQKIFSSPPPTRIFSGLPPTDETPMKNSSWSKAEPWWGSRRQGPKFFWLFNIFKTIKPQTMAFKKLYLWLKKLCQFITNLFFLANIPTPG